jgi:hypothetical protein
LLIIPVRSGYGPAVSSGDTAHADDVVVPPLDELPPLVVDDDGEVGEAPQAAANAALAAPRSPIASRLLNARFMKPFQREGVAEVLRRVEKSATLCLSKSEV